MEKANDVIADTDEAARAERFLALVGVIERCNGAKRGRAA